MTNTNTLFEKSKNLKILKLFTAGFISILIFNALIDREFDTDINVAKYLIANKISNINFNDIDRVKYYLTRDVGQLVTKTNDGHFKYELISYDSLDRQKYNKVVAKLPFSKPKYLLIKYD